VNALREELVERNVAKRVRVQRPPKTEPKPLSVDEVKVLLGHVAEHRLHAMFEVFALLGLRRSEVLGLQWTGIDLENGWLQVRRGLQRIDGKLVTTELKTQRSHRTVPLPAFVVVALRKHADVQNKERVELAERWPKAEFVFTTSIGTPIEPRNCTRIVQNERERAGLRRVRLHDFGHVSLDEKRTALDKLGELFDQER
jgi:integrase